MQQTDIEGVQEQEQLRNEGDLLGIVQATIQTNDLHTYQKWEENNCINIQARNKQNLTREN